MTTEARPAGAVTLEEVAGAARVSRATASRVVNGDSRVAEPSRVAVEAAVRQLGYVPNRAARSLVTRRSDSVAVVIPEPSAQVFGDPFFPRVLRGISDALAAESMQLVLLMPQARSDEERVERYLAAGHSDGVVLVSLHGSDPLPAALRRHGIPFVVGGRPRGSGITYVDVDNQGGAASAVEHLVEHRPAARGLHRRTAGHGARRGPPAPAIASAWRRPGCRVAMSSSRSATSRSTVAAPPWNGCSAATRQRLRCGLRRLRPDGARCHRGPARGRPIASPRTWPSSATTTRRWRPRRTRRSRACGSRSRRWAPR